jgi:hypothetical protein
METPAAELVRETPLVREIPPADIIPPINETPLLSEQTPAESVATETLAEIPTIEPPAVEPLIAEPPAIEPPVAEPPIAEPPAVESSIAEPPPTEEPSSWASAPEENEENVDETMTVAAAVPGFPEAELSAAESILSESDFNAAVSDSGDTELASWAAPDLPDVTSLPEMASTPDSFADAEPSDEIASHLDVPPLNLAIPALPEQNEPDAIDEEEEQEIEDMLATMMAPVTATAGN